MGILGISGSGEMACRETTGQIPFLSGRPERVMKWALKVIGEASA